MDHLTHLTQFARGLDALETIDPTHLEDTVPTCPDWTLRDLFVHLGFVYAYNRGGLDVEVGAAPDMPELTVPDDDTVIAWAIGEGRRLHEELGALGPQRRVSTFAGTKPAAWMSRRQAHETAVHTWDAHHTVGTEHVLDPELSADGIEEWLEMSARRPDRPTYDPPATLHLHATDGDGDGEWLISFGTELTWTNEHAKGDIAVRGDVGQLFLLLWGRRSIDRFETFGDVPTLADMILPI